MSVRHCMKPSWQRRKHSTIITADISLLNILQPLAHRAWLWYFNIPLVLPSCIPCRFAQFTTQDKCIHIIGIQIAMNVAITIHTVSKISTRRYCRANCSCFGDQLRRLCAMFWGSAACALSGLHYFALYYRHESPVFVDLLVSILTVVCGATPLSLPYLSLATEPVRTRQPLPGPLSCEP